MFLSLLNTDSSIIRQKSKKNLDSYCFVTVALIGRFSPHIHARLSEQFSESMAGYGTTLRVTGGYQKAGTSSLKRVTGRVFTINK